MTCENDKLSVDKRGFNATKASSLPWRRSGSYEHLPTLLWCICNVWGILTSSSWLPIHLDIQRYTPLQLWKGTETWQMFKYVTHTLAFKYTTGTCRLKALRYSISTAMHCGWMIIPQPHSFHSSTNTTHPWPGTDRSAVCRIDRWEAWMLNTPHGSWAGRAATAPTTAPTHRSQHKH